MRVLLASIIALLLTIALFPFNKRYSIVNEYGEKKELKTRYIYNIGDTVILSLNGKIVKREVFPYSQKWIIYDN